MAFLLGLNVLHQLTIKFLMKIYEFLEEQICKIRLSLMKLK